jgi:ubiquinone/menaquinone biosynthesis C-methylase UbiE
MTLQEEVRSGSPWDVIAAGYDQFVTSGHMWLAGEGLRRAGLRAGMRLLDVAAGSGALSIPAARLGAHVVATDVSTSMLEHLSRRAQQEGLSRVMTRVMDGEKLELDDDSFDVSASQFGVMLFSDMPRGIAEMVRVTRPDGRVLLHVYGPPGEVEFLDFFVQAIRTVVPQFSGPPVDPPPLPFQLQDPERLYRQLSAAGVRNIEVETVTEKLEFHSGKQLWDWLINSNPIPACILAELELDSEQQAVVRQKLEDLVRERSGGRGAAVLTNPVHIATGVK